MIQRIQTVYLIAIFAMMLSMFFVPMAEFVGGAESFTITAWGIQNTTGGISEMTVPTLQMAILMIIATLLPLVNIFLYKRRILQIRLCFVEIVLLIGVQVFIIFYMMRSASVISSSELYSMKYSIVDITPVISIILSILSLRSITKDEALVRSLDRIR